MLHYKNYCPYDASNLKYYTRLVFNVTGPQSFCSTANYSVTAYNGVNITWSATPVGIVSLQPNGNTVTATKITDGVVNITATITDNCGYVNQSLPINNIQVGTGNPPSLTLNYDNVCGRWFQALPYNSPLGTTGYNWSFTGYKNLSTSTSNSDSYGGDLVLTYPQFLTGLTRNNTYNSYLTVQAITNCGNTASSSSYYVPVGPYDPNNCIPIQLLNVISTLKISEEDLKTVVSSFSVFPNPFKNTIIVSILKDSFNLPNTSIRVVNMNGTNVKTINTVSELNTIPVSDWANGNYIITISDGKRRVSKKIQKQ